MENLSPETNDESQAEEEIKNPREFYQLGRDGISDQYNGNGMGTLLYCQSLLDPNSKASGTEEFKRKKIFEQIKDYPSYTEFMTKQGTSDFLTPKGRETVKILDEKAKEIKSLVIDNPLDFSITRLSALLNEVNILIISQRR
jgi:hypothetical protein